MEIEKIKELLGSKDGIVGNVYVFRRENLHVSDKDFLFKDINIYQVPSSREVVQKTDMVVFVDEDGSTKILKNRWGAPGVVISESQYKHYIELVKKEVAEVKLELEKLKNENNQSNSTPKKKHFMGGIFKFNIWPFNRS